MNKINQNKPKIIVGDLNSGVKPVEMHGQKKGEENPLFDALSMDSMAVSDKILHIVIGVLQHSFKTVECNNSSTYFIWQNM